MYIICCVYSYRKDWHTLPCEIRNVDTSVWTAQRVSCRDREWARHRQRRLPRLASLAGTRVVSDTIRTHHTLSASELCVQVGRQGPSPARYA